MRVLLVTGGSRSGKSRYALSLGEEVGARRVFVATCPQVDEEMAARIERHRRERVGRGWETVEEPVDLEGAMERTGGDVVLVDCLSLWVSNLLYADEDIDEGEIARRTEGVLAVCARKEGTAVFVSNEVGMGIVPDNALARQYRDLLGRCNQVVARAADEVALMVSGIPVIIKK